MPIKMRLIALFAFAVLLVSNAQSQQGSKSGITNSTYTVAFKKVPVSSFVYTPTGAQSREIQFPLFEINGKLVAAAVQDWNLVSNTKLKNGVTEYLYEGTLSKTPSLSLQVVFQASPDNPVLRFQYSLKGDKSMKLTKSNGVDNITYAATVSPVSNVKEIRFSEFNERFHATHRTEAVFDERYFSNNTSIMGPMIVINAKGENFLLAYEHGSQYPNRFLEFGLAPDKRITIQSVKGNYLPGDPADGFTSVWFEVAGLKGSEDELAGQYRDFMLRYCTQNLESRKPYIYYNTWGRQERVQWSGQKYLTSMNLDWTLMEIEQAHRMGIEVFVIDAGWFVKTGDWDVNKTFFPDGLKEVKARLDKYGMKLGLWFNPTVAALTSEMYNKNIMNRMSWNGKHGQPTQIWETEESVGICVVSAYWEDFAAKLVDLSRTLGVTYFKWDAIGQYGCNDANHFHGSSSHTVSERTERYAFLQPLYMSRIIDRVTREIPEAIFDFDITEDGRCVGLQFLTSGKYFIINNGPYYHNYDLAPQWKSVLPNGNSNIFVQPGPARGWFVRSVLDYDKWIPSVLFLSHYQPDEPRNSQIINIASLILGQNGIWGEILKASDEGVHLFDSILSKYKAVRPFITAAQMVTTGEPGGSPEIYEKIDPATGKGCVVLFASSHGEYTYVTKHKTANKHWTDNSVKIKTDKQNRAVITASFTEPSAKIIFFGVD